MGLVQFALIFHHVWTGITEEKNNCIKTTWTEPRQVRLRDTNITLPESAHFSLLQAQHLAATGPADVSPRDFIKAILTLISVFDDNIISSQNQLIYAASFSWFCCCHCAGVFYQCGFLALLFWVIVLRSISPQMDSLLVCCSTINELTIWWFLCCLNFGLLLKLFCDVLRASLYFHE